MDIRSQKQEEHTDHAPEFQHWEGAEDPDSLDDKMWVSLEFAFVWDEPQKWPNSSGDVLPLRADDMLVAEDRRQENRRQYSGGVGAVF